MKHVAAVLIALGSAALAGAMMQAASEKPGAPSSVFPRYSGVVQVKGPAGAAARPLRVEIKDWQMVRTPQGVRLPVKGFCIMQLTSGAIDTEIAGKQEHHKAGDTWTVAAAESMTVRFPPHSQAAKIKTVAVNPAR